MAHEQNIFRPLANFPPTIWGCSFASLSPPDLEYESYTKEVEELKGKVKELLMQSTKELTHNIEFINLLCRLGLSYHFENEIYENLNHIFMILPHLLGANDYDLHISAILFRVLRQHGFKMPCDVFNKFMDKNGEFKKSIAKDAKGLLSLYEASFLSVNGEDSLDKAIAFTSQHLEILAEESSPHLAKLIRNALIRPQHKAMDRIEARQYIVFYEDEETRNEIVLQFAKLDFNRLQILYKQELALLSRWWEDLNLPKQLPYIRDRIVEIYLWAIGAHFEPQFSVARVMLSKYAKMVSVVDDTYDAYGTFDELQSFATAFERCHVDAIDQLPEYMKIIYKALLDLFEETENVIDEKKPFRTAYVKDKFKVLVRAYITELEWFHNGNVPSFDEFMENGNITGAYNFIPAASFLGMEDIVGKKEYEWVQTEPNITKAAELISRLMDDIATHEGEKKRGYCVSSIPSYMKDKGVSETEAMKEIEKMCGDAWKIMNEEYMKPLEVPRMVLKYYVNLVRVIDFIYKFNDSYTFSETLKDDVKSLFLDPIPI